MIRETIYPIIQKNLPNHTKELITGIAKFVDRNSGILLSMDLSTRFSFGDYDRELVYNACGVTEDQMKDIIKKSGIHSSNKIQSNPFYVTCILAIKYFLDKNKKEEAATLSVYMELNMYTSAHFGFAEYGANKNIMDYTIANLDQSFILRRMKSLFDFLRDNSDTWLQKYTPQIKTASDKNISDVIDALWTRVKAKLKPIFNRYYENHKSGNYLNYDSDSYSEEDYHIADNDAYAIDRLSNKVYLKLINHQFDRRFITYSITSSTVSKDKLTMLIDDIISDDTDHDVQEYISSVIEYYCIHAQQNIEMVGKGEFISYLNSAYNSNTSVDQMVFVKKTLERWLVENMAKYGKVNYGKTAKLNYKKALFMFFIFVINAEAKSAS